MSRRSNGEGSLRKLPSGSWCAQIMVGYTDEGKRKIKTFTASTKTEVQQKVRMFLANLDNEQKAKAITSFSQWADTWYADYRTQVEASTYWNYSFTLKTLKDYFKDCPVNEIKPLDINRFIDTLLEKGLAKSTIGKCKAMLVQIFTAAEDNGLIEKNPAIRAKAVKPDKAHMHRKGAFTPDEIKILKERLPNDLLGNSIIVLIGTGLRVQELLALTKDDIAPDGSMVTVNKAVKIVNRLPYLGSTKSEKGNRIVPVSKEYRPYVMYLREHGGSKYIWTSGRENGLYTIEQFRNRYERALKKISNVTYYPPHCCRHTYITMLQAKQVPMDLISVLAGHGEVSTTLGYTHTSIDTLKGIIDALDKDESA